VFLPTGEERAEFWVIGVNQAVAGDAQLVGSKLDSGDLKRSVDIQDPSSPRLTSLPLASYFCEFCHWMTQKQALMCVISGELCDKVLI